MYKQYIYSVSSMGRKIIKHPHPKRTAEIARGGRNERAGGLRSTRSSDRRFEDLEPRFRGLNTSRSNRARRSFRFVSFRFVSFQLVGWFQLVGRQCSDGRDGTDGTERDIGTHPRERGLRRRRWVSHRIASRSSSSSSSSSSSFSERAKACSRIFCGLSIRFRNEFTSVGRSFGRAVVRCEIFAKVVGRSIENPKTIPVRRIGGRTRRARVGWLIDLFQLVFQSRSFVRSFVRRLPRENKREKCRIVDRRVLARCERRLLRARFRNSSRFAGCITTRWRNCARASSRTRGTRRL